MLTEEMEPSGADEDANYWESPAGWADVMPILIASMRAGGEAARIAEEELKRLADITDRLIRQHKENDNE